MYGDPDIVKSKTRKINALYQTSSVSTYASEFRRLQASITWNDQALFDRFYEGLRENVKDGLVHENPRPTLLEDLISATLRIDGRIYERILERKSASARQGSTSRQSTVLRPTTSALPPTLHQSVPPTRTNAHDASTPMELDQQRAPLSPEEKQRRVEFRKLNNLCLWCGSALHNLTDCLTAPKPGDPRYREPRSRVPLPALAAQQTFNFVTNSANGSIAPERRRPRVTLGPSMGATFTLTPPRHALFKVLSVTALSAHSHSFLPYSDLDPHLHIIIVEIEIWTGKFWMQTFAMIDSGWSANMIDSCFA